MNAVMSLFQEIANLIRYMNIGYFHAQHVHFVSYMLIWDLLC